MYYFWSGWIEVSFIKANSHLLLRSIGCWFYLCYIYLPLFIRQKLSIHCYNYAISIGIFFFLNIHCKVNSTHNSITKFVMDDFFLCGSVYWCAFVKAINERVNGNGMI